MGAEDVGWKLLGLAAGMVPTIASFLKSAIDGGHGDDDTRKRVAEILPAESASAQALKELGGR